MAKTCESCVLLVDDDPSIRDLLSRHLKKAGFEAFHAEDGIDALGKLRDSIPKVIISDLQMPRMSGFEFIGVVRRRFPTIPVIALSGSIPNELPAGIKPHCWFEKKLEKLPDLVRIVHELARTVPDHIDLPPQVVPTPVRVRPGFAGYSMLTCTDCLRPFRATTPPGDKSVTGEAVCTHCEARVPFPNRKFRPRLRRFRPLPRISQVLVTAALRYKMR
jgi:CheY-like chemotaxis protein